MTVLVLFILGMTLLIVGVLSIPYVCWKIIRTQPASEECTYDCEHDPQFPLLTD